MSLLPTNYSLFSSIALVVLTMAGMQMFREQLAMEGNLLRLGLGGFLGSWVFIFSLTAIGNMYSLLFPQNTTHVRLFPECLVALVIAVVSSAMVHRICATTCILFSLIALYYLNKISNSTYNPSQGVGPSSSRQGRRQQNGAIQSSPKSPRKDRR